VGRTESYNRYTDGQVPNYQSLLTYAYETKKLLLVSAVTTFVNYSRGSSVSIVTDYGLHDQVSVPNRGHRIQTDSGTHPASYSVGTGGGG
jgi:hypothetical protein